VFKKKLESSSKHQTISLQDTDKEVLNQIARKVVTTYTWIRQTVVFWINLF
jgi:hypothetical protein